MKSLLWNPDRGAFTREIKRIVATYLGGNSKRISANKKFIQSHFLLADGIAEVSGMQIIFAAARLERPGIPTERAVRDLGGPAAVAGLIRMKYLGLSPPDPDWAKTGEALRGHLQYIVKTHLGNKPDKISVTPKFLQHHFLLADGITEVSGWQIVFAVARLERPGIRADKTTRDLGGPAAVTRLIKSKYLGSSPSNPDWAKDEETLRGHLQYVVTTYLGGALKSISMDKKFIQRHFLLSDGVTDVSGVQIIFAVAHLERPGMPVALQAIRDLGGGKAVTRLIRTKYFEVTGWDANKETLGKSLQYIVRTYLGGRSEGISTGPFARRRYLLADGTTEVSGQQIANAVARLERPTMRTETATRDLGGLANVIKLIRTKYLEAPGWGANEEVLGQHIRYIVKIYLGNDLARVSTNPKFMDNRFLLADGITEVSGGQIVNAVARLERPGIPARRAIRNLGGPAAVISLTKEKYLGRVSFQRLSPDELEKFIRENSLEEIVDLFANDAAMLAEALAFLREKEFQNREITEFVKAYVGLQVGKRGRGDDEKGAGDPWEKRRRYVLAIIGALERGDQTTVSEEAFQNLLVLLIRLSRKPFEEDPGRLIGELEGQARSSTHPLVQRLHTEAAGHFQKIRSFEIKGMRTPAYGYQREGVLFLATHDRAILADEAGMGKSYQTIAATESLGLRRVLWVTTAANKETLREEILTHSRTGPEGIRIVISGDPAGRKEQIRGLNGERYVITNYETLVALQKSDPEGYKRLTDGLDAVVIDEAQLTDNPDTLRTKAIHGILTPRRWLLTASLYQNRPERLGNLLHYLDPARYPNQAAFRQMYTGSTEGLRLLHSELRRVMLRRSKKDTLTLFQPEEEMSFQRQLAGGIPRLPRKIRIPTETSGHYFLSEEQADLIAWMTADFSGWADHFNVHLPEGACPIVLQNINPLLKFEMIQKVIYQPEYFGFTTPNPVFEALDRVVEKRLKAGEKVILWCWNTSIIDVLEERYRSKGVRRIDGTVLGAPRDRARQEFQKDPDVRILVANYVSGGVGLTLTAAHAAIFVQLPPQYPLLYQTEGRHHRLIGPENIRHAKERVEVEWMVPGFPPDFVETIRDARLKEILTHGTLVEQTRERLEGGEALYHFLMEGYGDPEELETWFKAGMIRAMGLDRDERPDHVSHLRGKAGSYAQVTRDLLSLWQQVRESGPAAEKVLRLVEKFKDYPAYAKKIGDVFRGDVTACDEDLDLLLSLFEISNKYIREQIFERVPGFLVGFDAGEGPVATPAALVAQLCAMEGSGHEVVVGVTQELSRMRDTPLKRYLEEHLLMGLLGIMGNKGARSVVDTNASLFHGARPEDKIHAMYRLGLLARTRPDLLGEFGQTSFDTWSGFFKGLERKINQSIGEFVERPPEEVEEMIGSHPDWKNADHLLALIAGWQAIEEEKLLNQFGEILRHLLDGDYREWRNGPQEKQHGASIDYLSDSPEFWERFTTPHQTRIDRLTVPARKIRTSLFQGYLDLIQEYDQEGEAIEGIWVKEKFEIFRSASHEERDRLLRHYRNELRLLGSRLGQGEVTDDSLVSRTGIRHKLEEIHNLLSWMTLDNGFRDMAENRETDRQVLIRELDTKARYYRSRKQEVMAEHIETLKEALVQWGSRELSFRNLAIEDIDDPALLSRMGALHPQMVNCFNPNGNPVFNQFVIGVMGSRNMRLVVVREEEKIIAAAMMKVKELESGGSPILFLEKGGLYRKGYDFRSEMLAHLLAKAKTIPQKPLVMDDSKGKPREGDPSVLGTGAYTKNEYVESVFGLRGAGNVLHRGRVVTMEDLKEKTDADAVVTTAIGIGTSNKTIEDYIKELKVKEVKVVVDIRANPHSQWFPHFNRTRLEESLRQAGISYVWLGEKLGNPKDRKGNRTLAGFRRYMKTGAYEEGKRSLIEVIRSSDGCET